MSDTIQGSDEWLKARLGKLTGSRMYDIIPGSRGRYRKTRVSLMNELIYERLTGESVPFFETPAIIWGREHEDMARAVYEAHTGLSVDLVGSLDHPRIKGLSGSPDGLVGDNLFIEIKCPNSTTHLEYLSTGIIPEKYMYQIHTYMLITERNYCDFVSFDPRLPSKYSFMMQRVKRNIQISEQIEKEAKLFLRELNERMKGIEKNVKT